MPTRRRRRVGWLAAVGVLLLGTAAAAGSVTVAESEPVTAAAQPLPEAQVEILRRTTTEGLLAAGRHDASRTASPSSSDPPAPTDLQAGIDTAAGVAADAGATVEIVLLDRSTGQRWSNGRAADQPMFTASLVKLFLADHILTRAQAGEIRLGQADRALLTDMLTGSGDAAASTLYERYGRSAMVTEVAQRYGLRTLLPTNQEPEWELSQISAADLVTWYDEFLTTAAPTDVDFVLQRLRAAPEIADDGFDQWFGVPSALPGQTWALKQGWMNGVRQSAYLHTSAVFGPDDRYVVAILVQAPGSAFPIDLVDRISGLVLAPFATATD